MPDTTTILHPAVDRPLERVGLGARFAGRFVAQLPALGMHLRELGRQCFAVGVRTLPLITLTGFITGMVFTQQSRPSLAAFGAVSWLPSLILVALIRSLAPLVTALVAAGKIGSSIGAELGSMRVTEQIEAMEVSAIDPFKFLVVTRTAAITLMMPVLTCYFGLLGAIGSFVNVHANEGTTPTGFLYTGFETIDALDIGSAFFRALVFGLMIGLISCYAGFHAGRGTVGVGRAANAAVVRSMLAVFLSEVFIVQIIALLKGA